VESHLPISQEIRSHACYGPRPRISAE
jgi:hypothetical protein